MIITSHKCKLSNFCKLPLGILDDSLLPWLFSSVQYSNCYVICILFITAVMQQYVNKILNHCLLDVCRFHFFFSAAGIFSNISYLNLFHFILPYSFLVRGLCNSGFCKLIMLVILQVKCSNICMTIHTNFVILLLLEVEED